MAAASTIATQANPWRLRADGVGELISLDSAPGHGALDCAQSSRDASARRIQTDAAGAFARNASYSFVKTSGTSKCGNAPVG